MRVKGRTKLHVKLHTESCAKLIAFMHVKGHAKRQRIKCQIACKIEIAGLFFTLSTHLRTVTFAFSLLDCP